MPIPSPGIPSATNAISSVELQTTLNNKAFYVYSGKVAAIFVRYRDAPVCILELPSA